jgi:uncharacterized protein (DUF697 family)
LILKSLQEAQMNEQTLQASTADDTVRKHMWGALAIALIPYPWVDMAALSALQLNMLNNLAKLYQVEFSKERGKSLIAALAGGSAAASIAANVGSLFKAVPLYGLIQSVGSATLYGASTYAVGKVFIQHFESGGTFLNFDPEKVKEYYGRYYIDGASEISKPSSRHTGLQP